MGGVTSESRLSDFFLRLADDPALLGAYERDPRAALGAAGLRNAQVDAVLEGGHQSVREALEAELSADPLRRRLVTAPRMTAHTPVPEPDGPEPEPEPPEPEPPGPERA